MRVICKYQLIFLFGKLICLLLKACLSLREKLIAVESATVELASAERAVKKLLIRIKIQDRPSLGTCVAFKHRHYNIPRSLFAEHAVITPLHDRSAYPPLVRVLKDCTRIKSSSTPLSAKRAAASCSDLTAVSVTEPFVPS